MTGVDIAVIGRGLMGTACARHLAEAGHRIALIGPDEPLDQPGFDGPFGSFHDAGRITRHLATDPVWALLAERSIARYAEMSDRSRIPFFTPCGGAMVGADTAAGRSFVDRVVQTAAERGHTHELIEGGDLTDRLPMFDFAPGSRCVFDPFGGVIDPRAMRRAEEALARQAGCHLHPQAARAIDGATVTLQDGRQISAGHIVMATGAYATTSPLAQRAAMQVRARTVVLAEVTEAEAARLSGMPSLVFWPDAFDYDLYLLPPIRYPDGRLYVKIGGEGDSPLLDNPDATRDWFRSSGSAQAGAVLLDALRRVMPGVEMTTTHTESCAVSFTQTGHPYIARLNPKLTLLTGGNGAGAKCADELGRLGALVAQGHDLRGEGYGTEFAAVLA